MPVQRLSHTDKEGNVRCYGHNLVAALRTSYTIHNPGRVFYCCPLSDPDRCKFFSWKDQLGMPDQSTKTHSPPNRTQASPSTPTRSPNVILSPLLATPTSPRVQPSPWPSSPSKRTSTAADDEARQKRLKTIQNALISDQGASGSSDSMDVDAPLHAHDLSSRLATAPPSTPQSSRAMRLSQQIKEALNTPESPSPMTAKRSVDRSPTLSPSKGNTYRLQDLGLNISSASAAAPGGRRQLHVGSSTSMQPATRDDGAKSEDELWKALTPPPSSIEPISDTSFLGSRKDKGKERQGEGKCQESSDSEDESNWLRDILPQPSSSGLFSTQSQSPSLSSEKIKHIVDELSDVPRYMEKLERKLAAMEKSNTIKVQRIRELEEKIKELESSGRSMTSTR